MSAAATVERQFAKAALAHVINIAVDAVDAVVVVENQRVFVTIVSC